jgi:hypothetical protein
MRIQVLGMGEADEIGTNLYSKPPKRVIVYHNNIPSPLNPLLTLINSCKQAGKGTHTSASNLTLPPKLQKALLLFKPRIRLSLQTIFRNLNISPNVLHQTLQTNIIILRANEPQNHQIHMAPVEVLLEIVHDVHFDAAHRVLVERVPADAHDHRKHCGFVGSGGRGREAGPAVVDT